MGRIYVVSTSLSAASATEDLITVKAGASSFAKLLRFWVMANQATLPSAQMLNIKGKSISSGTLSVGSGGSAFTPVPQDPGDPAAVSSARTGDTTQATGTFQTFGVWGCYIYQGLDVVLSQPIPIVAAEGLVIELTGGAVGGPTLSIGALFEEVGK